jgi:mRNA (guanine-N7-)-methyltransferase
VTQKDYGLSVLDICCGKGGDFKKFDSMNTINYRGTDIAMESVKEAVVRYNKLLPKWPARFCCADIGLADLRGGGFLDDDDEFDLVSCQFALHYLFASKSRIRKALQNISGHMRPGGYFVGTTTDANVIVRKLRALPPQEGAIDDDSQHHYKVTLYHYIHGPVYSINFYDAVIV